MRRQSILDRTLLLKETICLRKYFRQSGRDHERYYLCGFATEPNRSGGHKRLYRVHEFGEEWHGGVNLENSIESCDFE